MGVLGVLFLVLGISTTNALAADTLSVAISPGSPEQGIPASYTFSGTADPIDSNGDGPQLRAEIRAAGGLGCQDSYADDRTAEGSVSSEVFDGYGSLTGDDPPREGPGSFGDPYSITLGNTGGFVICAYLQDDSGTTLATSSLAFNVTGPVVSHFQVGLAGAASPGSQFLINYTTQTDQKLTLYSVIQPAGGQPCPASYELAQSENLTGDGVNFNFAQGYDSQNSTSVYGGPSTVQAADTESQAGSYLACTWVEGPNTAEVDAVATTPFAVGTTVQPPQQCEVPSVGSRESLTSVESAIRAAGCGVGRAVYATSASTPRGYVVRLTPASGTEVPVGTAVQIVVSLGPPAVACVVPAISSGIHAASFEKRVRAAHCRVGHVVYVHTKRFRSGVVLATNPRAHTRKAAGTFVNLTVSAGPAKSH